MMDLFIATEVHLNPLKHPKPEGKIPLIRAVAERLTQKPPGSVDTDYTTPLSGESDRSQKALPYCGFWG